MPEVKHQIVDGFDGLHQVFDEMHDRAEQADFADTLDGIVNELEKRHQDHFSTRSDPTGQPWPVTQWFRYANPDHETLEDRGTLRQSLTEGGSEHIFVSGDNEFEWGTSVIYAGIHQEGATIITGIALVTRGRSGGYLPAGSQLIIPARPFVGMSESFVDETAEVIADDLVDIIRN